MSTPRFFFWLSPLFDDPRFAALGNKVAHSIGLVALNSKLDSERAAKTSAAVVGLRAVTPHEDAAVTASAVKCAAELSDVRGRFYPA